MNSQESTSAPGGDYKFRTAVEAEKRSKDAAIEFVGKLREGDITTGLTESAITIIRYNVEQGDYSWEELGVEDEAALRELMESTRRSLAAKAEAYYDQVTEALSATDTEMWEQKKSVAMAALDEVGKFKYAGQTEETNR